MLNIIGQSPSAGSKSNPVDSNISFYIKSDSYGIKLSSVIVKINDEIAFKDSSFTENFKNSKIEFVNSDLYVELVREYSFNLGDIPIIEVTASNLRNKVFNRKYYFEIEKPYPILIDTNLNSKITDTSILYLEFSDSNFNIDVSSLNISIDENAVITNGSFQNFFNSGNSSIENGSTLVVRIDHPEFFRNGKYNLKYSISNISGYSKSGSVKFEIDIQKKVFPNAFPMSGFVGKTRGIKFARNLGIGDSIEVESPAILPRSTKSEVFYLIYYSAGNKSFFDNMPKVITSKSKVTVDGLTPSKQLYWAVRCLEAYKDTFDFNGMEG